MAKTRRVHVTGIYDVYCMRPGPWGNPFSHVHGTLAKFKTKNREESVEQFRRWLRHRPDLVKRAVEELRGKRLACICGADQSCHVDVWIEAVEDPLKFLQKGPRR